MNRIPPLVVINRDTVRVWIQTLLDRDIIYFFENDPTLEIDPVTRASVFTPEEVASLNDIVPRIYDEIGDEIAAIGCELLDAEEARLKTRADVSGQAKAHDDRDSCA
jgi:hypothetical protein